MDNDVVTYLKYATLQMAAESLFDVVPSDNPGTIEKTMNRESLVLGNMRASRFTEIQADQFISDGWRVIEHKSNTRTGFSGTLFKYEGVTDPGKALINGELVLSFRSTEFADDAARDNQATNDLEIRPYGWAFGQIADMEAWYQGLRSTHSEDFARAGGKFAVTGYSLGGHIATAFAQLRIEDGTFDARVSGVYTFNGAGVGRVGAGRTLSQVLDAFSSRRTAGNADLFTDARSLTLYREYRGLFNAGSTVTGAQVNAALATLSSAFVDQQNATSGARLREIALLLAAIRRIETVVLEAERVGGLPSGTKSPAATGIATDRIDGTTLDYQLAVLKAKEATSGYGDIDALLKARNLRSRESRNLGKIIDIYGDTSYSLISNSQRHFGVSTPLWIEDQPEARGDVMREVVEASARAGGVKLLTQNFGLNDFGDTHSLALIVDSLVVQAALQMADPELRPSALKSILNAASNARVVTGFVADVGIDNQGTADGDSLENLVNTLAKYVRVDSSDGWIHLIGDPRGGTWMRSEGADGFTGRDELHGDTARIAKGAGYQSLGGKVSIEEVHGSIASRAKDDFGALVALESLSPFLFTAKDAEDQGVLEEFWKHAWTEEYSDWMTDSSARAAGNSERRYSDSWFDDRASMLASLLQRNRLNSTKAIGNSNTDFFDTAAFISVEQRIKGVEVGALANRVTFGSDVGELLHGTGSLLGDRIYGGAGDDFIDGKGGNDYIEGNSGVDDLYGGDGNDTLLGGADDDTLSGEAGNDTLSGGKGDDSYRFDAAFGKDTITDSDDKGSILIDTKKLGEFKGAGKRGGYAFDMGGGQYAGLAVIDSASSKTGYKAVIVRGTDTSNTITIDNFDPDKAREDGYLGISIDSVPDVALVRGGGTNFWHDIDADKGSLEGESSTIVNGSGATFMISLREGARAGATIILHLAGLVGKGVQAILGDETVDADGAVISLAEGQTQVSFALVQEGDLDADAFGSLSVSYQGDDQGTTSNIWNLTLKDSGETTSTFSGDTVAMTRTNGEKPISRVGVGGAEFDVVDPKELYFDLDSLNNLTRGTLEPTLVAIRNDAGEIVGYEEVPSDDVKVTEDTIYGTAGNDKIDGKTGNDLLAGNAGNDVIDGGAGDDMIGGGAGNDQIHGGDGNDYISSSADVKPDRQQLGPQDRWSVWGKPAGVSTDAVGAMWGAYRDENAGFTSVWDGLTNVRTDEQSDSIDAGAGDDWVIASWGNDRILGGAGNDRLQGLAGDDILEGGEGDDKLDGDGILQVGYQDTVDARNHGSDFVDGGGGDDVILGGGGSDNLFGGAGDDTIFADGGGASDSETFVELQYQGEDYIDGEDGDDYAEGGAKDDTLYGGSGADTLWGDTSADNLKDAAATDPKAWGNDYLDGEDGDDLLYGGGGDDILYGGKGKDRLTGDDGPALDGSMHGADYLDGEEGDDTLIGGGRDDMLFGGSGADTLMGDADDIDSDLHGADYLDGGDGDDLLYGGGGDDTLYGGEGKDQLVGDAGPALDESAHGADYLDGGEGDDALVGGGRDDVLFGGAGDDTLMGDADDLQGALHGADYLNGEDGNDALFGQGGADQLFGGEGNDELQGDDDSLGDEYQGADLLDGGAGNDRLFGGGGDDTLIGGAGADEMSGDDGDDLLSGGDGADVLAGGEGNDTLDGGEADDSIYGGSGNDQIAGGAGNDDLNSGDGDDVLDGGAGDDRFGVFDTHGRKTIIDQGGTETLDLGWKLEDTELGRGSLLLRNKVTGQEVHVEGFDADDATSVSPIEHFVFLSDDGDLVALSALEMIAALGFTGLGTDDADLINGTAFNDNLDGGAGDDVLAGNEGDDRLTGGAGANQLLGGLGDDVYVVGALGSDEIVEFENEGQDRIEASVDYVLTVANVETILLTGSAAIGATGKEGGDHLIGNMAANVLDGAAGADLLEGLGGDDTYRVDDAGDAVIEQSDAGTDTVIASVSYVLPIHVETLFLTGDAAQATGNDAANHLQGNSADNRLRGMAGIDRMEGGEGNDVYVVREDMGVKTIADTGGDQDLLDLGWNAYATHFVLGSTADRLGVYNASTGQLVEIEGFDPLSENPVSSIEKMVLFVPIFGGVEQAFLIDQIFREQGLSFFGTSGDDTLTGTWRRDSLYGLRGDDTLRGLAGDDVLDGGSGRDRMAGASGDDTYYVENPGDTILEVAGEGFDTVYTDIDFSIQGTDVEWLEMTDTDHRSGTGNDLRNYMFASPSGSSLFAQGGNDEVFGREGDDTLHGGTGDDHILGREGNDLLAGDEGDDELRADQGDDVLVGGSGNDRLFGAIGNDLLDAGAGDDSLWGGEGDDILGGGEGDDILRGEEGRDLLSGGDGDDTLLNSQGADILAGGGGNDTYREDTVNGLIFGFGDSGTLIVEESGGGTDTVVVYESFTLGENVENLTLLHRNDETSLVGIGNGLDNRLETSGAGSAELFGLDGEDVLVGGAGTNRLDGGSGADLMVGGAGPNAYFVDDAQDRVVASADGTHDVVHSTVDFALGDFVEDLVLEEGSAISGIGNDLFNKITGNSNDNILDGGEGSDLIHGGAGNDILIGDRGHDSLLGEDGNDLLLGSDEGTTMLGGAGIDQLIGGAGRDILNGGTEADIMVGGAGDDVFVVDDAQDVVAEDAGAGTDLVVSFVDYILSDSLENLTLAGYGLTGVGNAQDNVIAGDQGGESLFGLDGDDILDAGVGVGATLDGGAGRDTLVSARGSALLIGGEGDDLYRLGNGNVAFLESPGGGYDRVVLDAGEFRQVSLYLSENVEELDASSSGGNLYVQSADDDNLIVGGSGKDVIDGGGGNDTVFGGNSRGAVLSDPGNGIAAAMDEFFRQGVVVPRTFEKLLADFQSDISQDSAAIYQPFAYTAWLVPAAPGANLEPIPLFVSDRFGEPQPTQALFVHPDGSLTWEGGGILQDEVLANWRPHSGPLGWDQLQAEYGLRTSVSEADRGAYLAVSGNLIPAPEQIEDGPWGDSYALVYWPKDRLPADMQALLDQQLNDLSESGLGIALAGAGTDALNGGDGNDLLDGGDGNDALFGGAGADVLVGGADNGPVSVSLVGGSEGTFISIVISQGEPTNDDVLDGGAGLDTLMGGSGNDTYYVDGESAANPDGRVAVFDWCDVQHRFGMDGSALDTWVSDSVVELEGEGTDTVIASASVVLANVEAVVLSDTAPNLDIDATTGAGAQTLFGNSGRNTLDGGQGADLMAGGAGDDTYVVDDSGDGISEAADAGQDIVRTTVDGYALGDNLEAVVLDGNANLSASGNDGSNILIGNSGNNALDGGEGDDFLAGWRGDDILRGGAGYDYYLFARGDGQDTVDDSDGELHFSGDIRQEELIFSANAYDLVINVAGTDAGDGLRVTLADWLRGEAGRIAKMSFCTDGVVAPIEEFALMQARNDAFTVQEGAGGVSGNLLDNDSAAVLRDRLTMYVPYAWSGRYGTAQADENGSFEYTLNADSPEFHALAQGQIATDYLSGYNAFDSTSGRYVGTADIQVSVVGVNDGPTAEADFGWATEDWETVATGNVLANDSDIDQDELVVGSLERQLGAVGFLEIAASGEYRYVLDNDSQQVQSMGWDQWLTESFQYVTVDSHGAEALGTLAIDVYGNNDAPVGADDAAACLAGGSAVVGNVLDNDSDIDVGDILAVAAPGPFSGQYGTLELGEDGRFSYSADDTRMAVRALAEGQRASDVFTYTFADNHGEAVQATLTIEVVGVNDGPVLHSDAAAVSEDGVLAVAGNVLANDSDPDVGDSLIVSSAGTRAGQYGTLSLDPHGAYSYNLANGSAAVQSLSGGQKVTDVFAYTVTDLHGASATAQLTVEVTGASESTGVTLIGTSRDDKLVGTAYSDVIDGGKGSDTLVGAAGDDIYFVDVAPVECNDHRDDDDRDHDGDDRDHDVRDHRDDRHDDQDDHDDCNCERGDSVVELANAGVDTVAASVNYVLPQNVEHLMLLGSAARTGSGNSLANVIVGGGGANTLSGAGGNDVLVGRSAGDVLNGDAGNDTLYGEGGNDKLDGGQGADRLWGGAGNDLLEGGDGDNLLSGGEGDDAMTSGSGSDVVVAGAGNDKIATGSANDFIDAGAGNDIIDGGSGSDFIAAGKGIDSVTSGAGRDVIAFNRGDGQDTLKGSNSGSADVLSLGGGIRYADLTLNRRGADLVLGMGAADQVTSKDWYTGQDGKGISTLQIVTVGGDFKASSTDKLLGNKVVAFDFIALAQQYDAARKANATLGSWALQPALNSAFIGASKSSAFGGNLAFDYATSYPTRQGYGTDMTVDAVRSEVNAQTGANWQSVDVAPAAAPGPALVDPWVALQAGTDLVVSRAAGASNPITPTNSPTTDSLVLAALLAASDIQQQPTWAVK